MVDTLVVAETGGANESRRSGVSWAAVIAGGLTAAAVSVCMVLLGAGWGLSIVSPWASESASLTTIGVGAVIWLVVTQWVSAGLGGYLTGRLRTRWTGVHTDEVFFRDTANGFLSWALATVVVAALLSSAGSALIGKTVDSATAVAVGATAGAAQGAASSSSSPFAYYADTLYRPGPNASATTTGGTGTGFGTQPAAPANRPDVRAEGGRILATVVANGDISADDKAYLARSIAAETGLTQEEAAARVDSVVAQVKEAEAKVKAAADEARSAAAKLALISFVALLIGAFIASVAAAFGGNLRDDNERTYAVAR